MRAADLPADLRRKILGKDAAKAMRKAEPNEGENLFRFQLKSCGLPPPLEQYPFAHSMGRKFAADFCWLEYKYKIIVEIQGGLWIKGGGAHSRPQKIELDMERQQYAALLGFLYLPFTPDDVFSAHAINWTEKVLRAIGWRPVPKS